MNFLRATGKKRKWLIKNALADVLADEPTHFLQKLECHILDETRKKTVFFFRH